MSADGTNNSTPAAPCAPAGEPESGERCCGLSPHAWALITAGALIVVSLATEYWFRQVDAEQVWLAAVFPQAELTQPLAAFPAGAMPTAATAAPRQPFHARIGTWSPIVRWDTFARTQTPTGAPGVCPTHTYFLAGKQVAHYSRPGENRLWSVLCALLAGTGVYLLTGSRQSWRRILGGAIALRGASLCWAFSVFGFFTVRAVDQPAYVATARSLLQPLARSSETTLPLGNPLLHCTLLLPAPGLDPFFHSGLLSFAYAVAFGIGTMALLMYVLWRWAGPRAAQAGALLLTLFPWIMRFHYADGAVFTYPGLDLAYPVVFSTSAFHFMTDVLAYNALSDAPALFFTLLTIAVYARALQSGRGYVAAGACLGAAMLMRPATVLCGSGLACLLLCYRPTHAWKGLVKAAIGFFIAYTPQLLWNAYHNGSPLVFGYGRHVDDSAIGSAVKAFNSSELAIGLERVVALHQQVFLAALVSLWCLRRFAPITAAWIAALFWPTLLYYLRFSGIQPEPVRYVLLPLFVCLALPAVLFHRDCPAADRRSVFLFLACLLMFVPGTEHGAFLMPLPGWLPAAIFLSAGAAVWWWCGRRDVVLVAAGVAAVGAPAITFAALTAVCGWAVVHGIHSSFRRPAAGADTAAPAAAQRAA
jgi:hypothetical protein